MNRDSRILAGRISFINGYSVETGPLERNGQALDVQMDSQRDIKWVSFQVLKTEGPHSGLTEWEIFNHPHPSVQIYKILVNGEFAYHWDIYPGETVESRALFLSGRRVCYMETKRYCCISRAVEPAKFGGKLHGCDSGNISEDRRYFG